VEHTDHITLAALATFAVVGLAVLDFALVPRLLAAQEPGRVARPEGRPAPAGPAPVATTRARSAIAAGRDPALADAARGPLPASVPFAQDELLAPVSFAPGAIQPPPSELPRFQALADRLQADGALPLVVTGLEPPGELTRYQRFLAKQRAREVRDRLVAMGAPRRLLRTATAVVPSGPNGAAGRRGAGQVAFVPPGERP